MGFLLAPKTKKYADKIVYDLKVIGIPKTIDNDLKGTDNCPGFEESFVTEDIINYSRSLIQGNVQTPS